MDFGRVSDPASVDYAMPPDDPDNQRTLSGAVKATPCARIGTPRWADPGLVGVLYPAGTRPPSFLRRYGEQFAAVELNSTYYGVQPDSIRKWAAAVPDGFRFCPKFPQRISHDLQLVGAESATEAFVAALDGFGDRLGLAWLLLPEGFGPERYAVLRDWMARYAAATPLALEVRHPAWFAHPRARQGLFRLCEEHGVTLSMTDVAGRRDVLHQRITASRVMVRFVGQRHHATDFTRLDAWVDRLAHWFERGLSELYFFLHQPEEALNVAIAEYFIPRLHRACGIEVAEVRRPAQQGSLFE